MPDTNWTQVNLTFPGNSARERELKAVAHLRRILPDAEADGLIAAWFFTRKGHWRIRYLPAADASTGPPVHRLLTQGVEATSDIYEPETHAFGGTTSMAIAHQLFHADSRHLLTYLSSSTDNRRELSIVLSTAFMRAAGLEFGEQGDVWARIADQRAPLRTDRPPASTWATFTGNVRELLLGNLRGDDLTTTWVQAFQRAGEQLRHLREQGHLTRGIRAVAAEHAIFHWNRIGILGPTQAVLARAAADAVFGERPRVSEQ
ncbi:bacteriocin biosynthesis protein [Actinomadura logoneensis]|uniref:Bacteriocin biosynthesis protein n=1 Tax=Actinomadura logoneensis TaxID=2293572 RepID=A0A372JNB5_9ACTN|nr:thiopeptide-type bacteriocin biosynthesis protein [Actinomadura logoneensis]RFU41254.1 bacteriocin biosynthesis protein [Actinomadura logoneensis]